MGLVIFNGKRRRHIVDWTLRNEWRRYRDVGR